MNVSKYDHGIFNWTDLQTTDLAAAKSYYAQMFGWSIRENPVPGGGVYAMASLDGKSVCGMSTLPSGEDNIPPHWNTYVSVDDIEEVASRVQGLGGTLLAPPFEVMDAGRMAVLQDPDGAAISLWQPVAHIWAEVVNEPSSFCWNELYTKDLQGASRFYGGLFGWTFKTHDAMGFPMQMIEQSGREIGTMLEIQSEWGPMPAYWAVYFAIDNCDDWLERSREIGGGEFLEAKDIPGVGRFAGVTDPQGAHLMVVQLREQAAGAQS